MRRDPSLIWAGPAGKTTENSTVEAEDGQLGRRWADALRSRFPGQRLGSLDIKSCSAAFGVSLKTAEHWATGVAPLRRYLVKGWRMFGWSFLAEVLGDPLPTPDDIKGDLDEARRSLAQLDRRLQRLGGGNGS